MEEKIYSVSQELRDLMLKSLAAGEMRDKYIELRYFGHKQASRAAFECVKFREDFWAGVKNEFPELNGKRLRYDARVNELVVIKG